MISIFANKYIQLFITFHFHARSKNKLNFQKHSEQIIWVPSLRVHGIDGLWVLRLHSQVFDRAGDLLGQLLSRRYQTRPAHQVEVRPVGRHDDAASLGDDDCSGGDVPAMDPGMEVGVSLAGADKGNVKGGRTCWNKENTYLLISIQQAQCNSSPQKRHLPKHLTA